MRPDSIEIPPQPIKPDAVTRVNPSRQKEREDQRQDAEDLDEKSERRKRPSRGENRPSGGTGEESKTPPEGKSSTRGRRLDMLV